MRYQLVTQAESDGPRAVRQFRSQARAERAWERAAETNYRAVLYDTAASPVIIADYLSI